MRSVPTCEMEVTLLVFRYLRSLATKPEGAAAVVRAYSVRWQRKPESMSSCSRWSGLWNLIRKMRCAAVRCGVGCSYRKLVAYR
jgi:hypothetical protein